MGRQGDATSEGQSERHGGGYIHISPEGSFMGGGMWHPEAGAAWPPSDGPSTSDPTAYAGGTRGSPAFAPASSRVNGDSLKRVPTGYAADHPHADLLRLKDVTFGREVDQREAMSPDLPRILADDFAAAVPVMRFLASLEVSPG